MRNLITTDLAYLTRIIKRMGIKNEIKALLKEMTEKKSEDINSIDFGMDIMFMFIENYDKAEQEVINFIAELEGKTKEEIKTLPMAQMIGLIQNMLSLDGLGDFFKLVLR